MGINLSLNLFVRFYTSYSGNQNMWIEQSGCNGRRYAVNSIEDVKNSFEQYILQIADKNNPSFDTV